MRQYNFKDKKYTQNTIPTTCFYLIVTDTSSAHTGGRYVQNGFDPTPDDEIDDLALKKNKKEHNKKKKNLEMVGNKRRFPQKSSDNETVKMYLKGRQRGIIFFQIFFLSEFLLIRPRSTHKNIT